MKKNFLSPLQRMGGSHGWEKRWEAVTTLCGGGEGQCVYEGSDWAGSLSGQRSKGPHPRACRGGSQTHRGRVLGRQSSDHLTAFLGQVIPWEIGKGAKGR